MKVLISGGAGFIGSHLAHALAGANHELTILDNLSPQIHGAQPEHESPTYRRAIEVARLVRGDVRDPAKWIEALDGQEVVVHLAAETGTGQSMYEIERYADTNVRGTAHLLDLLVNGKHTVRKVVLASSRVLYGEGKYRSAKLGIVHPPLRLEQDMKRGLFEPLCPATGEPMVAVATDEESKIHPVSIYGVTKHTQEQLIMLTCRTVGVAASALRFQNVYGPGQSLKNPYTGVFPIFSNAIRAGRPIDIFEDGLESRDFVYIDDAVEATRRAIESPAADGEVFGVGSGVPTTVLEMVRLLGSALGKDASMRVTGAFRMGDIRHNFADLTKIRTLLGFEPQVFFDEGLRRFVQWAEQHEVENDRYRESLEVMKSKGLLHG